MVSNDLSFPVTSFRRIRFIQANERCGRSVASFSCRRDAEKCINTAKSLDYSHSFYCVLLVQFVEITLHIAYIIMFFLKHSADKDSDHSD